MACRSPASSVFLIYKRDKEQKEGLNIYIWASVLFVAKHMGKWSTELFLSQKKSKNKIFLKKTLAICSIFCYTKQVVKDKANWSSG